MKIVYNGEQDGRMFKDVIGQTLEKLVQEDEDVIYLDADLIGSGSGCIISNGKVVNVTWSRDSLKSNTVFKDEGGNVVPLNPGNTWWHLLNQTAKLTIN